MLIVSLIIFRNSDLALRAALLHMEALKSRDLFAEMAMCCIRWADIVSFETYLCTRLKYKVNVVV